MVVDFILPGSFIVAGIARSWVGNRLHRSKWARSLWTQVGRIWLHLKLCHGSPVLRGPQFGKRWRLVYKCWSPLGWKWNPSAVICPGIPAGTYVTLSRYVRTVQYDGRDDVSVGRRPLREVQGVGIGAVFEQTADRRMARFWLLSANNWCEKVRYENVIKR
jgi:hypothetical protein